MTYDQQQVWKSLIRQGKLQAALVYRMRVGA